jgi:hypothetical protein
MKNAKSSGSTGSARRHAPPALQKRVQAVLDTWPGYTGQGRASRAQELHQAIDKVVAAWGGQWLNPGFDRFQELKLQCAQGHVWRFGSSKLRYGQWCPQCARESRRAGIDAMQALARERKGRCLSDTYVDSRTKLRWQCGQGHIWEATPLSVKTGKWCSVCSETAHGKAWLPQMQALARQHEGRCLSDTYVNSRTKLRWQCGQGHIWEATPASIKVAGAWCPVCARERQKLTIEEMHAMAQQRGGQCLSSRYADITTKLRWRCDQGHSWNTTPAHIRNGQWCPTCAIESKKLTIADMQATADAHGGRCLSKSYAGINSPLRWQCAEGHVWQATPAHIRGGHWCASCAGHIRYTLADMQALARSRGGRCLSETYINNRTKLQWQCKLGHEWKARPDSIIRGTWCAECAYLAQCRYEASRRKYLAVK